MGDPAVIGQAPGTLFRHANEGWLRITGPDRKTWLQGIVTADVLHIDAGAFWSLLLDRTGKIRHEVIGIEDSESVRLFSLSQGLDSLYQYLDSMLVMEDAALEQEPDRSLWSLHGHVAPLTATTLSPVECDDGVVAGRLAWLTPSDWVFAVAASEQDNWLARMRQAGFTAARPGEWDHLRVLAGVPAWGVDYSAQDTPHHAGLFGRAVAPNKGCYIGQEVVCKVEMRGHVPLRVARVMLDSSVGVAPGASVTPTDSGEPVGTITSVVSHDTAGGAVALARVKTAALQANPELRVGGALGRFFEADAAST